MKTAQRATGRINVVQIETHPYDESGALTLSEIHVVEEFTGDLCGMGTVRFLMAKRPDGSANFAGLEKFTGTLAGHGGSFVFRNCGTVENGEVVAEWSVVPGSGTGDLAGLRGQGGCRTATGIFLDYWFE